MERLAQLPGALLPWYQLHKRQLPWRQTKDPYAIWLSEIMLQQTRVEAVKGYYHRFLQALPNVEALAQADDELLMKLWEGLGYYSRVRNLKKAAQQIMQLHGGVFPCQHSQVMALPGIGAYTAGAICSIAFEQKTPAVDGNVLRVYARLLADTTPIDQPAFQKQVRQQLQQIYPEDASNFTQALMELGATICGPNKQPACAQCPCRSFCLGNVRQIAAQLPVKPPKKGRRVEEKTVFLLRCDGCFALQKRPAQGLLAGLWQFPELAGHLDVQNAIDKVGLPVKSVILQMEKNHIFTHIEWKMLGYYLEVEEKSDQFQWFTPQQIQQEAALPTAYRQFWEAIHADHI